MQYQVVKCDLLPSHVWRVQLQATKQSVSADAGQYVFVACSNKATGLPFSIANSCPNNKTIELHIRDQADLKLQEILSECKQLGFLYLSDGTGCCAYNNIPLEAKHIILAVGGTGFAMAQALLQAADHAKDERNWHLYFSATTTKGFYYLDAVQKIQRNIKLDINLINRENKNNISEQILSDFQDNRHQNIILSAGPFEFVNIIRDCASKLDIPMLSDM